MQKTFLIGLGGHKCGTTWLHDYLSQMKTTKMGAFKEYHIFDARELGEARYFLDQRLAEAREQLAKPEYRFDADPDLWKRIAFLADPEMYFAYFADLLSRKRVQLTGDITPSYSGLSAKTLTQIRKGFERRDIRVRAMFLMRDPVERAWSAVRMRRREALRVKPDLKFKTSEDEDLRALYTSENFVLRASYDRSIQAILTAFPREDVFFGFYETLFNVESIQSICAFLGLDYVAPDFGVQKNVSPKKDDISETLKAEICKFYAASYQAAAKISSEETVCAAWPSARAVFGA